MSERAKSGRAETAVVETLEKVRARREAGDDHEGREKEKERERGGEREKQSVCVRERRSGSGGRARERSRATVPLWPRAPTLGERR